MPLIVIPPPGSRVCPFSSAGWLNSSVIFGLSGNFSGIVSVITCLVLKYVTVRAANATLTARLASTRVAGEKNQHCWVARVLPKLAGETALPKKSRCARQKNPSVARPLRVDSSQWLWWLLAIFGVTPRNIWGDSSQYLGWLLAIFGVTPCSIWGNSSQYFGWLFAIFGVTSRARSYPIFIILHIYVLFKDYVWINTNVKLTALSIKTISRSLTPFVLQILAV